LRIAYILTTLGIGGAEKQVISLAERMSMRGHIVTLIVLKHDSAEEWPVKLPVMRLNMQKTVGSVWKGLRFASSFLTIFNPDILHSHTFPANMFARLLRWHGARAVVLNTIHNVYEGGWHRMLLYRFTDRYIDLVTAVSTAAAERFVHLRAVRSRKMTILTNGIDADGFVPSRGRRKEQRSFMRAGKSFVWLAVGRLVEAKDYPNMLRAFALVHDRYPDALLWIAGEGEEVFAEETLCEGVQMLGLRRDVADLMDAADGFVLSSSWEGMPLSVGEAMVMEKPVVATDVGGVHELVGDAGVLVPAKDSAQLAEAMLAVMEMTDKQRAAIGHAARERIRENFSMDAQANRWQQLYLRLLEEADS
jgi:glycosyltransferase involved in cell wall biosynthesis